MASMKARQARRQYSVYRHFDATGTLLYIGSTGNASRRLHEHNASSWFGLVARTEYEHCCSRNHMIALERELIEREKPPHNLQHRPSSFRTFLHRFVPSTEDQGLFLEDARADARFPDASRWREVRWYLIFKGAHPSIRTAALQLWQAFRHG